MSCGDRRTSHPDGLCADCRHGFGLPAVLDRDDVPPTKTHCPHGYNLLIARSVCGHCDPEDLPFMEGGWTPREIRQGFAIGEQRDAVHWTDVPPNKEYGYCHCKPCVLKRRDSQSRQQESPQLSRRIKA